MVDNSKIKNLHLLNNRELTNDELIGLKVKEARVLAGMSMLALGKELGVTFQQIQKYEKGLNRISAGALSKISVIVNQPIQFFFKDVSNGKISSPVNSDLCSEDEVSSVLDNYKGIKKQSIRTSLGKIIEELKKRS